MKYHKCLIEKEGADLGEDNPRLNCIYKVYDENGKFRGNALTLSTAKDFIDHSFNDIYL